MCLLCFLQSLSLNGIGPDPTRSFINAYHNDNWATWLACKQCTSRTSSLPKTTCQSPDLPMYFSTKSQEQCTPLFRISPPLTPCLHTRASSHGKDQSHRASRWGIHPLSFPPLPVSIAERFRFSCRYGLLPESEYEWVLRAYPERMTATCLGW
jgi:hypothetical protein